MVKESSRIKKVIKQLIKSLESRSTEVSRLILYGSYAHGNYGRFGDIDIAIISSSFKGKTILQTNWLKKTDGFLKQKTRADLLI